ncbi:E3 ubiquitin ligase family protein [Sphaerobacter thermophilus]|jgi:hypothetical protein|uniref:E3 ubiquitin ligase family protein n=1 Tax=Sphaerobacter thermophilus TaxID=2057 RepID=UPI000DB2F248|nr:MAG: hypothetical protein DIU58_13745 [Sphaerobacter thermophilus]
MGTSGVLLIIGLVAAGIGAVLLFIGRRIQAKTDLLAKVPTVDASEVASLIPGEMIEVKGVIRCDTPLTAELAQRACVYYSSRVVREYEYRRRNAKGETVRSRRSETVAHNEQSTPFYVEDSSGRVLVDPEGAEVDAQKLVDRFERNPGALGPTISLGGISLNLGGDDGTIGYRYQEHVLPVDIPVYVLGVVQEGGTIGRPPAALKGRRFIISYRAEEALRESWGKKARWLGISAVALFALAVILFVVAVGMLVA